MPKPTLRVSLGILCLLLLGACATIPPGEKRDPRDPWERVNRTTYKFNDKLDKAVLRPVAHGYVKITPRFVRTGVHNFFTNLDYTIVMLNDLLQGQVRPFFNDTSRFLLNSTLGIAGLFDPATAAGLDRNDREFGQTLGKWGVPTGPYFVIPILGASDVRDTFGRLADDFSTPRQYIKNTYWNYGLFVVQEVDVRTQLLPYDKLVDSAYDPYTFVRNAYLQNREFKVHGGASKSEEQQEEMLEQQADEDEQQTGTRPPQQHEAVPAPPSSVPPQNPPPH